MKISYKLKYFSSTLLIIFLFSACSSHSPQIKLVERGGIGAIVLDNDSKVTYLKEHGHIERFCASREADASTTYSSGFNMGTSTVGNSESFGESNSDGQLSLGGRSPTVLIARELMYRTCELTMNLNTDEQTSIELYKETMDVILAISKNINGIGSASTEAEPQQVNSIPSSDTDNDSDNDDNDEN